jgi:hypothetical protein
MHTNVIGLFGSYDQAEAAVRDLEMAGIVGEAVEVIGDPDQDARAEKLGMKPRESFRDRIAHVFGGSAKPIASGVHDDPGDMPKYIGEQEFYATHVLNEGAIIIVRVANDALARRAEGVLIKNGSKTRDGKDGAVIREEDDRPHLPSDEQKA